MGLCVMISQDLKYPLTKLLLPTQFTRDRWNQVFMYCKVTDEKPKIFSRIKFPIKTVTS